MSFSLGSGGGLQDPAILKLLAELTTLVKQFGASSSKVINFIEKNKDKTFIDKHTQHMHTFKEVAEPLATLIQGIKNPKKEDEADPADWWKE